MVPIAHHHQRNQRSGFCYPRHAPSRCRGRTRQTRSSSCRYRHSGSRTAASVRQLTPSSPQTHPLLGHGSSLGTKLLEGHAVRDITFSIAGHAVPGAARTRSFAARAWSLQRIAMLLLLLVLRLEQSFHPHLARLRWGTGWAIIEEVGRMSKLCEKQLSCPLLAKLRWQREAMKVAMTPNTSCPTSDASQPRGFASVQKSGNFVFASTSQLPRSQVNG